MANTATSPSSRSSWLLRPQERVLLAGVRASARVSRTSLATFLAGARHGGPALRRVSAPAAVDSVLTAYRQVPAYRSFVDAHGGLPPRPFGVSAADWVAQLPVTGKHSYVDAYPVALRCSGGRLPSAHVEVDESSGSSGRPYQLSARSPSSPRCTARSPSWRDTCWATPALGGTASRSSR